MYAKGFYAGKTVLVFKKGLRLNDILYRHVPKTNGFSISVVDKASEQYWRELLMDGNDFVHGACVQYDLILCVASSIKSRKGVPYETVVAETLSAYVQNLSPSGVVILYVESDGEISASQSTIVFEELNKRLAYNEINATYYAERHYVLGEKQHGMYVCVEPYSIRDILNRVAIYSGADERFFHNSLMYWNPIAKKFEEDGTEINVHVKKRGSDVAQFEEAYRSMLEYYARLIDPTKGFLSGSISYYLEKLGYDILVIKRNDIKDETINRIRRELLGFESNKNHEGYTQPIVGMEDNSLSARYSEITSKTEGYGNSEESPSSQLERTCVALMVLLERIGAYLHGIYVAEMDMGTINKSKLLYMYFDVSRIEESSSHICFKESGFSRVTNYLKGLFLHRSQDKLIYYIQKSQVASVKAAIGSIMSRNGSHNIGSHVLAALSHNVGTMPDDRVLYQYIQHRMDYIATATTDFPVWKQPTMFVATVMKEFLRQTHLLDYISGSEGLHAYKFQGPLAGGNQEDTIRIHVRRVNEGITNWENKGFWFTGSTDITEFVIYPKDNDPSLQKESVQQADFSKDVSVAIPGGVVGQHAFYTILENILRNAAKHEWSKSVKKVNWIHDELNSIRDELRKLKNTKEGESDLYKSDDIPQRPKHLDLYVDFVDSPIKSEVECRVWNDKLIDVRKNSKATAYIVSKRIEICNQKNNDAVADTSYYVGLVLDAYDDIGAYNEIATKQKDGNEEDRWGILSPALLGNIESSIEEVANEKMGLPKSDPEYNKKRLAVVKKLLEEEGDAKKFEECLEEFFVCQEIAAARCLKHSLMAKISECFIEDGTGQLRKENWGIAEMRISAGYLQCSEIDVIGGLSTKDSALSLIWPVLVKNDRTEECIGYRFKLQKPKELLVIVPEGVDSEKINKANLLLSDYGIEIMTHGKAASSKGLAYSYALIDQVNFDVSEEKWPKLPLRVLTPQKDMVYGRKNKTINIIAEYQGSFYTDIGERLNGIIASKDVAKESAMVLLREVYESWVDHLRQERGISNESCLLVDVAGTANGAGKSLITDADLLHFVFKHLFNSSTRGYLSTFAPKYKRNDADEIVLDKFQMNRELAGALYSLITLKRKPLMSVLDFAKTSCNEKRIAHQLSRLNDEVYVESMLQDGKIVGEIDANIVDSVWGKELNGLQKWFCFVYLQKACDAVYQRPKGGDYADFRAFVRFLGNVVLEQTRAILAKYEERIATLPTAFGVASTASVNGNVEAKWMGTKQTFLTVSFSSNRDERAMQRVSGGFCYWRHGDDNVEEKDQTFIDESLYFEPLSGSQSYLGMLSALQGNVGAIRSDCVEEQVPVIRDITRLMENALLRILIIDERTKKFVSDHQFEKRFKRMGIFACDENDTLTADLILGSGDVSSRFEIVVVHQGIIDKLWKDHSQSGVDELLQNFKRRCRYVVITTGRGIPANIPQTARVLPFSIIEGSLFKQYPEKMILVDAIMNILPTGRRQ